MEAVPYENYDVHYKYGFVPHNYVVFLRRMNEETDIGYPDQ